MQLTRRAAIAIIIPGLVLIPFFTLSSAAAQEATPTTSYSCETVKPASPMAGMEGMAMGTPAVAMDHAAMELDLAYIDMMIPHHASIIAMAEAALPRLADERLREIAQAVIATQQPEIEELRGYRGQFYGSAEPMPMDDAMMAAMDQMMPGMAGTMEEMAFQMNTEAQVATFCAADNPDLAFIDLTIPHHQMAIEASETAVSEAAHPEIRDFAQRVIDAQQREIETLQEIRTELAGKGTPTGA
jgi:uncharacterized protein (DUF305 family)